MSPETEYDPIEELDALTTPRAVDPWWRDPRFWVAVAVLAGALIAIFFWVTPAQGQEPEEDPVRNCWRMTEQWEATAPWGDTMQYTWLLCPERSVRGTARSPLSGVFDRLYDKGPEESRWWADQLRRLSAWSLEQGLCRAVIYVRSVSPPDPEDERERSAEEIKAWVLSTLTGPGRPPETRALRAVAEQWEAETLRAWHDSMKRVWPEVAELACPEMEQEETP